MNQAVEAFFCVLYSVTAKKEVLQGRASGKSIRETAKKLNTTDQRVRQIEAKITRKLALSHNGRRILSALSGLSNPEEWRAFCGEHSAEMLYLLRLYKQSFYYDGSSLENLTWEETPKNA